VNCPRCNRLMTERYDAQLDIDYLTGVIKEQLKVIECCDRLYAVPVTITDIEWKEEVKKYWAHHYLHD
jgi:hypothetical protein